MIIDNGYAVADAGATFDSASPTGKRMLKSYPDAFEPVAPDAHLKAIPAPGRILPARPR